MPLTGKPSKDIRELMESYEKKGKIGRIKPKSKEHARKIAIAIALHEERRRKRRRK